MTAHGAPAADSALAAAIQAAVIALPAAHALGLAAALDKQPAPGPAARRAAFDVVASSRYRQHATAVLGAWALEHPSLPGTAVALAIRTAQRTAAHLRSLVDIDIAWTGPASFLVPVRRTREVLFEVIDAARATLILVSFAAYNVPDVNDRLRAAADRGVDIRLVLETKEDSQGALSVDAALAFGALQGAAAFYVWPAEERPDVAGGKASMHAKAALADDEIAFVTSANLTGRAQTDNIELGVVVRGGPVPQRLGAHFRTLMTNEVLRPVVS
jgi:phosphatidylserine/phosphatidylglycerophosphate/cardiolipin synthase-like enzyme